VFHGCPKLQLGETGIQEEEKWHHQLTSSLVHHIIVYWFYRIKNCGIVVASNSIKNGHRVRHWKAVHRDIQTETDAHALQAAWWAQKSTFFPWKQTVWQFLIQGANWLTGCGTLSLAVARSHETGDKRDDISTRTTVALHTTCIQRDSGKTIFLLFLPSKGEWHLSETMQLFYNPYTFISEQVFEIYRKCYSAVRLMLRSK
jgi:hypothetical protein